MRVVVSLVGGRRATLAPLLDPLGSASARYPDWLADRNALTPRALDGVRTAIDRFGMKPVVSLVMPVHNPPLRFLQEAVRSVRSQVYERWELCIADDASVPEIAAELEALAAADGRVKLVRSERNLGISGATNLALGLATGDFTGFLDHDDLLDAAALFFIARALDDDPCVDVIYTDRDFVTAEGIHCDPYFKPDWSPYGLLEHNYPIHFLVVRRSLLQEVGGLRGEYDGAQDYDLLLRLAERTRAVRHVSEVLYSWRRHGGSNAGRPQVQAFEAGRRALTDALARRGLQGSVELVGPSGPYRVRLWPGSQPFVSIIISSRTPDLLRSCVTALRARTTYPSLELLVATNSIGDEALRTTCCALGLELVEVESGFFSRMNNEAARRARGELVVFLNDDTEVQTPDWIEAMLGLFELPGVTAVGPRLVYPSGATQFTRAVMGIRRDGRAYIFDPFELYGSEEVFGFSLRVATEVFAVSGGCLMVRRSEFVANGGFDEENFAFSYQDLDWMVQERESGHTVMFTPHAVITHFAQVSKRKEPDMMTREAALASAFITRHRRSLAGGDPTWSPALFDVHGLLDPVPCLGLPNLELPEDDPLPGHGLARCSRFAGPVGAADLDKAAREACRSFAGRLVAATGCRTAIDLGCGVGFLLEALAALGVEARGLDRSRAIVKAALPRVRDQVLLGDLREAQLAKSLGSLAPFDVAVATFVLERLAADHLPGVLQELTKVARRLALVTPLPNLLDRLEPGCLTLWSRGDWLAALGRSGWREDQAATKAVFGAGYREDPDLTLAVLVRGR